MGRTAHIAKRTKRAKSIRKSWGFRTTLQNVSVDASQNSLLIGGNENGSDSSSNSCFMDAENLMTRNHAWCSKQYYGPGQTSGVLQKEKEFGTLSSDECDLIMAHNMCYENETISETPINGNRIEISYFTNKLLSIQKKHLLSCTCANISVTGEKRRGTDLVSLVLFKCLTCEEIFVVETENPKKKVSAINVGAVWGTFATGSTFMHLYEFLSCLDIPCMTEKSFMHYESLLGEEWKESLWISMEEAGRKEKENAIRNKNICDDGMPWVTVYLDGSWSKRSYGTNFNSLSGMVGIIGQYTGELLYVAVRNKFCCICTRAQNQDIDPKPHTCYKNWQGSTTAMEADMVVCGFNLSEEMHGVRYKKFVADGDSSVYVRIRQHVSYGSIVEKSECTNHALKNYGKHLRDLKKDTKVSTGGRKILTISKIEQLTKRAKSSIYEHSKNSKNVSLLQEELLNGVHHVFGDHLKCRITTCNFIGDTSTNQIPLLRSSLIYDHLKGIVNLLSRKAHLLIENENNNRAERLMNTVARFNMGKRLNLIQRGSYERRVFLSGLRYNYKFKWHARSWKKATGESPGKHFKTFLNKQTIKQEKDSARKQLFPSKKKLHGIMDFSNYGPNTDLPNEEISNLKKLCKDLYNDLQVDKFEQERIAKESIGQFGNRVYEYERNKRLTASLFGRVMNRRGHTPCHSVVKACLYTSGVYSKAMEYGIKNENVAINIFQNTTQKLVTPSGLWVDLNYGFLAASPDGLIGEDALIEVKCLYASSQLGCQTIDEVLEKNKKTCLIKKDGKIQLKRQHPYFYQVQGQLNICQRSKCYFIIYINDNIDLFIEEIARDEDIWKDKMLPRLTQFYQECIAPEILYENLKSNKRCIDPPFIQEAIRKYFSHKTMLQNTDKKTVVIVNSDI